MLRALAVVTCLLPALSPASPQVGSLSGSAKVVNGGPGDQTDPHVSGALVAYTSESGGTSEIRYQDMVSGVDQAIPNDGAFDFVSDISGSTVVFTRVNTSSAIYTYEVGKAQAPVELAPQAGSSRRAAVIGGRTVAWQDFGYTGSTLEPEIALYDLDQGTLTRLTDDRMLDRTPSVSPDGKTVVWAKCDAQGQHCDIWQARWAGNGFNSQALTGSEGEESQPDTNGDIVVYASTRTVDGVSDRDIYWKPVNGGTEQRLALPGLDANPSISGSLIAFERRDPTKGDFDIALYDLDTQTLYLLTQSPENENLNDLSVSDDGTVRVVWTVAENGDFNVRSFTFKLPRELPCDASPAEPTRTAEAVCTQPGSTPLLAALEVARTTGQPNAVSLGFHGLGAGVMCVDNGYSGERATSGWVWLDGAEIVDPSRFKPTVSLVARDVTLDGNTWLAALISGNPGSSFRIRIYGTASQCGVTQPVAGEELIPGHSVAPLTLEVGGVSPLTFVPLSDEPGAGCSASGTSVAAAGLVLVALWLARPRRVSVVVSRKELRRRGRAL
ncbi:MULTISPECIES: TolB family protein [Myxococcus]|uniref:TolB family protein n=1 Tax=Myxococcus TaxID=32 RepID=UPI0013D63A42|nr:MULTISPECIES: MYXO-CTERM sorting domain-containing protein [Myxococcus]NVJ20552.1 PD40 domain-containing protein [Myxococcus sp. AM011]